MNKYKKLFSDILIFSLGTIGSKLILFLLVPLYTRVLSPEQYGISELVFLVGQLLTPVISLTIYDALFRFALMKNVSKENVLNVTFRVFFVGAFLTIAITPLLSLYHSIAPYRWYVCFYVILSFASQIGLLYLKCNEKNKIYSILCILQALFLIIFNIVFLIIYKLGVKGYLLSTILSMLVITLLSFAFGNVISDLKKSSFSKQLFKRMIAYSIPLIFSSLSWLVIHSINKVMVEVFMDDTSLGLYTAASKIPSLLNVVGTIFNQAWAIATFNEYENENDIKFYSNVFKGFYIILFFCCLLIILLLKPFMSIYVGKDFFEAWKYVPLLLLTASINMLCSFFGTFYSAATKSTSLMVTTIIAAVVNIILNIILIKYIGIYGAILSSLIAYLIIFVFRCVDVKNKFKIELHLKNFVINLVIIITSILLIVLDMNIYICSLCAILLFALVNIKYIIDSLKTINSFAKKILTKKSK